MVRGKRRRKQAVNTTIQDTGCGCGGTRLLTYDGAGGHGDETAEDHVEVVHGGEFVDGKVLGEDQRQSHVDTASEESHGRRDADNGGVASHQQENCWKVTRNVGISLLSIMGEISLRNFFVYVSD